jgi:hypothetical protein
MKRKYLTVAVVITIAASLGLSSCVGSFALSNKLLSWNKSIGSKFVNEIVFFAFWVLPVYEISILADSIVINSIEFWSGSNPVACGTKVIDGEHGRYLVNCDGKGYTITSEADGSEVRLNFDADDQAWSVQLPDGTDYTFLTFVDDTHVKVPSNTPGEYSIVELSGNGVLAYQQAATAALYAMR